jgi:hypothetical protein
VPRRNCAVFGYILAENGRFWPENGLKMAVG